MSLDLVRLLADALGLGAEPRDLTVWQVSARALAVYALTVLIVRFGASRFLGRNTVFDMILVFVLGSMMSRAVNGAGPLPETVVAGAVLVAFHGAISTVSFHARPVGLLVKGHHAPLIEEGRRNERALRRNKVTPHDLEEAARLHGLSGVEQIRSASLERNGTISVVPLRTARVVDVRVDAGVQTVRIRLES